MLDLLRQQIAQQIAQSPDRRLTFAQFMQTALYHPTEGYYSQGRGLGAGGDFATSVHLCADFGELVAVQLAEMWERLDRPDRFDILEMGAGQGLLAGDILRELQRSQPACFQALHYTIVEQSAALRRVQQHQLKPFTDLIPITWTELDQIADQQIQGCCLSNELLDAFPVHRIRIQQGELYEIYVTCNAAAELSETIAPPSTPDLLAYCNDLKRQANLDLLSYPDGYTTEVNLAAKSWVQEVARVLQRGYVLTIDYGYDSDRYYATSRHDGTLQCYTQHRHHDNPYINLGTQDITAHVDFGTIERWGAHAGLTTLGRTRQALFLMALGLGDRLAQLGSGIGSGIGLGMNAIATGQDMITIMQRREVLHGLIDPAGVGNFQVLIQAANLPAEVLRSPLKGLAIPSML